MKIWEQITEESWCKLEYALDKDGLVVDPDSKRACQRCLLGWIMKVYGIAASFDKVTSTLMDIIGDHIASWQDDPKRTFAEVYDLVKKANI